MIKLCSRYCGQIILVCSLSGIFFSHAALGKNQAQIDSKELQDRTSADMDLASHLAEKPELMNIEYLECYLGPKDSSENTTLNRPNRSPLAAIVTMWRDASGHSGAYKLATATQGADFGAEYDSEISGRTQQRLKDMDKLLNLSSQPSFDEYGKPMNVYQTRSDTRMLVYQVSGTADINKIRVCYMGPPLAPPSIADMQEATQYRRDRAAELQKLGDNKQAARSLQAHLQSNPNDAQAHLMLAQSYKAQCRVNDAIKEYRIALDHCGDNGQLRQQCIDGLHSLQVDIPGVTASPPINMPAPVSPPPMLPRERINLPPSSPNIKSGNPIDNIDVGF